jgi:hypothetical protein
MAAQPFLPNCVCFITKVFPCSNLLVVFLITYEKLVQKARVLREVSRKINSYLTVTFNTFHCNKTYALQIGHTHYK